MFEDEHKQIAQLKAPSDELGKQFVAECKALDISRPFDFPGSKVTAWPADAGRQNPSTDTRGGST